MRCLRRAGLPDSAAAQADRRPVPAERGALPLPYPYPRAGWYCVGCEQYKDDGEMAPGHVCPLHRAPCEERREENYFFALSRYQRQIEVLRPCHRARVRVG